eukprot:gnl/Trimastix_PCT/1602.p1 GENE.gnl/Trimastix_PCT/1602~~gnl/Trimastix_PCT/1602.p1  ORF type:complete len:391 (-),score=59.20 gnl/Trimastix_PCT/1602:11-1027(-)
MINQTWELLTECNTKYILRKYETSRQPEQIQIEHSILNHLEKHNFSLAPRLIATNQSSTMIHIQHDTEGPISPPKGDPEDPLQHSGFFSMFSYLPGHDLYTWRDRVAHPDALQSAGAVLGRLHGIVGPHSFGCAEAEYAPVVTQVDDACAEWGRLDAAFLATRIGAYLARHAPWICAQWVCLRARVAPALAELPQGTIHGDYHQGNLKWRGTDVVGVFDFEWAHRDARLVELAMAGVYFCGDWDTHVLHLDGLLHFLRGYGASGCLTPQEHAALPAALELAAHFQAALAYWQFTLRHDDEGVCLGDLGHFVELLRWMDHDRAVIAKTLASGSERHRAL